MEERFYAIVLFVERQAGASLLEVASMLGVSERTARQYVHRANESLGGCARIRMRRGKGYELEIFDDDALQEWKESVRPASQENLPSTPDERVEYLLQDLLTRDDWITIDALSGILFVSRSSISNDLRVVEDRLAPFDLMLEKRPRYGIKVSGSEINRRICLASCAISAVKRFDGARMEASSSNQAPLADEDLLRRVASCVDSALAQVERYQLNQTVYQNLLVHISIAIRRMHDGCYVPMTDKYLKDIQQGDAYVAASAIARAIDKEFETSLPDEEIAYIAIHLAGKQTLLGLSGSSGLDSFVSDETWNIASQMVEKVWQMFRFDFRGDIELHINLARHIEPLMVRVRYHMPMQNPMLAEIKARYPLAYAMALEASSVLAERLSAALTEDEVGYLAIAFAVAAERRRGQTPKKRVLVVCATGVGSARLLEQRLRNEFGESLEIAAMCNIFELKEYDFADIDYVLSTVPLPEDVPVPTAQITCLLDERDVRTTREVLSSGSNKPTAPELVEPDLFFPHLSFTTKQEVLDYLCERVASIKHLPKDFRELVWQREELAPTAFGNFVAMPHPMQAVSQETYVSLGLLDNAVDWDGNGVQAVFLVCMGTEHDDAYDTLYEQLMEVLVNEELIRLLVATQDLSVLSGA